MRLLLLSSLAMAATSCAPPCTTSTLSISASAASFSCSAQDGGVLVRYRPYNALEENFVDVCTGSLDGGALEFAVTVRTCAAGASTGDPSRECSMPTLAPGRYAVGERVLVVPGDGGFSSCE